MDLRAKSVGSPLNEKVRDTADVKLDDADVLNVHVCVFLSHFFFGMCNNES